MECLFFVSQICCITDLTFLILCWSVQLLSAVGSLILNFPGREDTELQLFISFSSPQIQYNLLSESFNYCLVNYSQFDVLCKEEHVP